MFNIQKNIDMPGRQVTPKRANDTFNTFKVMEIGDSFPMNIKTIPTTTMAAYMRKFQTENPGTEFTQRTMNKDTGDYRVWRTA